MENSAAILLLALRLLMVLALYGFLGWALITLWRDLRKQAEQVNAKQAPPIQISLEGGDSRESGRFSQAEISIGRHPSNHFVLEHETVSSRHARLTFRHGQWWLEDLDSRNGTFLNDERVREAMVLTNEDRIRFGKSRSVISLTDENIQGEPDEE